VIGRTTRRDFQELARVHLRAARILLDADQWQSAYYNAGYSVECGLKACIARSWSVKRSGSEVQHED
jgi:HEPN domain-containing protein